jgi:hypothetical protein
VNQQEIHNGKLEFSSAKFTILDGTENQQLEDNHLAIVTAFS